VLTFVLTSCAGHEVVALYRHFSLGFCAGLTDLSSVRYPHKSLAFCLSILSGPGLDLSPVVSWKDFSLSFSRWLPPLENDFTYLLLVRSVARSTRVDGRLLPLPDSKFLVPFLANPFLDPSHLFKIAFFGPFSYEFILSQLFGEASSTPLPIRPLGSSLFCGPAARLTVPFFFLIAFFENLGQSSLTYSITDFFRA